MISSRLEAAVTENIHNVTKLSLHKTKAHSHICTAETMFLQVDALIQLVKHFGWTWVGVIAGDDDYGRGGANIFADGVSHAPINKGYPFYNYNAYIFEHTV